jgi:uncharacterized SAM-binding protein YcdF (DUF218 family)
MSLDIRAPGGATTAAAAAVGIAVAVTASRIRRAARSPLVTQADAVVVFGAAVWHSGLSTELRLRLELAERLYREGLAPRILCCGGEADGISEGAAMREELLRRGVASTDILTDDGGTSTRTAVATVARYSTGHWRQVLLVSSPYHMYRIVRECQRQDVHGIAAPIALPRLGWDRRGLRVRRVRLRQWAREIVANWWYQLTAWQSSRIPSSG